MSGEKAFDGSVSSIVNAERAASGGDIWNERWTLRTEFAYSGQELVGKCWSTIDLKTGAFVDTSELGALKRANGFDGLDAWLQDPSGAVTVQAGGDMHALAVSAAYRNAHLWWRPDGGGAKIAVLSRSRHEDGFHVLVVVPEGGATFEAWFDAGTHLLSRIVEQQGFQRTITSFADYRPVEGLLLPHEIVIDRGSGTRFLQSLRLTNARFEPAHGPSFYAAPNPALVDCAIAAGASESTIPFSLVDNHIYVQVTVNGQGPLRFIVDTGGHNILTPDTAEALGLKIKGRIEAHGGGEAVVESGFVEVDEIRIGTATIARQVVYVLSLPPVEVEGVTVCGMIGFETFRRFVIRIDYAAGTITLVKPGTFEPGDADVPVELRFYGHIPEIDGTFEGLSCKLHIDTGSRAELTLTKPFVDANALRERHRHGVLAVDGWGVGGPVRSYVVSGAELSVGCVVVRDAIASLATQGSGTFADPAYHGNIGTKLLKRFVVTFDYGRRRMYLKPRPDPIGDTGTFDRAGMWINAAPDGFEISDITPNGPAEAVGLKAGERIVSVDGLPTSGYALPDLRLRLRNDPAGTEVRFSVGPPGEARSVTITLRDQT